MFYFIVIKFLALVMKIMYRVKGYGTENIVKEGSCIICSNHIHWADPITLAVVSKRPIHFIAKKELFKTKSASLVLKGLGAFPVDRKSGRDINAMKTAMSYLKKGDVLGIFFQGRRIKEAEAEEAKSGVVLFALKTKSPIVPAYIKGNYKKFSKVSVKFGEPIYLDKYYDRRINSELLNEVTSVVAEKVSELNKE